MVAMLVGQKDGLHVVEGPPHRGEPELDLLGAETCIDKQAHVVGFEVGAVAAASAAQDGETQHEFVCGFSDRKASLGMDSEVHYTGLSITVFDS